MNRYFKTIRLFWSTAFASQLEYQLNFLIELLAMLGTLLGSVFILSLFFTGGRQLGDWTWESALVIQGVYTFLDGLTNALLRPNLTEIVNYVREGTLDYVLLKPIDSQFWLSVKKFSFAGLPEIILGLYIVFWAAIKSGTSFSFYSLFVFIISLSIGFVILYSVWFLIAASSIWFVKTWNATEVLRALLAAGRYPISAYPVILRFIFTLVLPVAFLTTFPAEAILGELKFNILFFGIILSTLSSVLLFAKQFELKKFTIFLDYFSILIINYYFSPLIAFTIYFCFLHSIRHSITLMFELDGNSLSKGFKIFLLKAMPLTILTSILCIISIYFLNNNYQLDSSILKVIFIGLASLTFPHILLEYFLEKNEK